MPSKSNKTSGARGGKAWYAKVRMYGRSVYLGAYHEYEEAKEVEDKARKFYQEEKKRLGSI